MNTTHGGIYEDELPAGVNAAVPPRNFVAEQADALAQLERRRQEERLRHRQWDEALVEAVRLRQEEQRRETARRLEEARRREQQERVMRADMERQLRQQEERARRWRAQDNQVRLEAQLREEAQRREEERRCQERDGRWCIMM
jgi:hypothetical protein